MGSMHGDRNVIRPAEKATITVTFSVPTIIIYFFPGSSENISLKFSFDINHLFIFYSLHIINEVLKINDSFLCSFKISNEIEIKEAGLVLELHS